MNPFTIVDYFIWLSVGCFLGAGLISVYLLIQFIKGDK